MLRSSSVVGCIPPAGGTLASATADTSSLKSGKRQEEAGTMTQADPKRPHNQFNAALNRGQALEQQTYQQGLNAPYAGDDGHSDDHEDEEEGRQDQEQENAPTVEENPDHHPQQEVLTETVENGILAMANRRQILLEKIDAVSEVGLQHLEQLKLEFKTHVSRLRMQVQQYCDEQEQTWRQLSSETRAAEQRLQCARSLVENLNAQGLGSIQM